MNIMDICSSSQLFAAYHVLHRLLVPRHSPCALSSLTLSFITTFLVNRLILKLLLVFLVYLIFHLYIFQCAIRFINVIINNLIGGLKWNRTIDLTLIRRAL